MGNQRFQGEAGIVLVLLGRHTLHRKPGVSGRGTSPGSVVHHAKERNKAAISISSQLYK